MSRLELLPALSALLLLAPLHARLEGQAHGPSCKLSTGPLREMVLTDNVYGKDTTYAIVFPLGMAARRDTVLVLGTGGVTDRVGTHLRGPGGDSLVVGFLLTNNRRTTTAVPAPPGLPTARYFRVRAGDRGWDAVFFVPDRDTIPGTRFYDDGTFWYARLQGGRWTDVARIGRVQQTVTMLPNASGLTQSGPLSFAAYYGEPMKAGGMIVWRRGPDSQWTADTISMRFAPITVSATANAARPRDVRIFSVAMIWTDEAVYSGFHSVPAAASAPPGIVRRTQGHSMNQPVTYALHDTLHVSWWEFDQRNPPNLWYQALDPERENTGAAQRRVASGINQFTFLAVPEGARTRLVWAYRPPDASDSAEVAVVANGEPKVVGRVAFPFGFMTSGVSSGDHSFILATSPRPVPGGEPSASRTLEVRVSCNEGT